MATCWEQRVEYNTSACEGPCVCVCGLHHKNSSSTSRERTPSIYVVLIMQYMVTVCMSYKFTNAVDWLKWIFLVLKMSEYFKAHTFTSVLVVWKKMNCKLFSQLMNRFGHFSNIKICPKICWFHLLNCKDLPLFLSKSIMISKSK